MLYSRPIAGFSFIFFYQIYLPAKICDYSRCVSKQQTKVKQMSNTYTLFQITNNNGFSADKRKVSSHSTYAAAEKAYYKMQRLAKSGGNTNAFYNLVVLDSDGDVVIKTSI
jgi:hypothetical protein